MKRTIKIVCILLFIFLFPINCSALDTQNINARSAVLIDAESRRILWEKSSDKILPMASTTKIMTCILALEMGDLYDEVTVSKKAASAPESNMHLSAGEIIKLEDLLYALMLESANDAAVAIAEHISGSTDEFCRLMTEKARELGAYNTSFETPNGLDGENHYSTAYDMAIITAYALENEKFRGIISTKHINLPVNGGDYKSYSITNKNRFLNEFQGAIGVKTGYTGNAGHCFVGAAERDGLTLISVVRASGWGNKGKASKWTDTKAIMNYGFETVKKYEILNENTSVEDIPVMKSENKTIKLKYEETLYAVLSDDEADSLLYETILPDYVEAPVEKGWTIGEVRIYTSVGEPVGNTNIISDENAEKSGIKNYFQKIISRWLLMK